VRVSGVRARAPPSTLKVGVPERRAYEDQVTATYAHGYRCTAAATVIGGRAASKGRATANAILNRCRQIFSHVKMADFSRVHMQMIGANESYGPQGQIEVSVSRTCLIKRTSTTSHTSASYGWQSSTKTRTHWASLRVRLHQPAPAWVSVVHVRY
jgi:hypothetical protein